MKKTIAIICVIIMFAIGIGTLAVKDKEAVFSEKENRMLEGMPEFNSETIFNGEFAANFEKFMIDRIPFRDKIININSGISQTFSVVTLEDTLNVINTKDVNQMEGFDDEEQELEAVTPQIITPTPTPVITPEPADNVTPTTTPEITPTPAPTATPDPNYFSGSREMSIRYIETNNDNTFHTIARFNTEEIIQFADILNTLSDFLPEDGHTIFAQSLQSAGMRPVIGCVGKGNTIAFEDQTIQVLDYYTKDCVTNLSVCSILEEPIQRDEYIYFLSDVHWTVEGIHYVYSEAVRVAGLEPVPWEEYNVTYEYPFLGTYHRNSPSNIYIDNPDTLALIDFPQADTFMHHLGVDNVIEQPLLDFEAKSNDRFTVYFGGPKQVSPVGIINTTSDTGKEAMVIIDSFGLPFAQMLIPHYDTVCVVDLRYMHKSENDYYIKNLIDEYGIDDIYITLSDLNSFGSRYSKLITTYMEE